MSSISPLAASLADIQTLMADVEAGRTALDKASFRRLGYVFGLMRHEVARLEAQVVSARALQIGLRILEKEAPAQHYTTHHFGDPKIRPLPSAFRYRRPTAPEGAR